MSDPIKDMDFAQWYEIGLRNSWMSPTVCAIHDGIPMTSPEEQMLDLGDDVCVHIMRAYEDRATRKAVEANFAPALWRRPQGV